MAGYQLRIYATETGRSPYTEWLESLADATTLGRIHTRLARLRTGNRGDHKRLAGGIVELRLDFGPGYRIYLGRHGDILVILCAGDKRTQSRDIEAARAYYRDYLSRLE